MSRRMSPFTLQVVGYCLLWALLYTLVQVVRWLGVNI